MHKNGEDIFLSSLYNHIYKATGIVNVSSLTIGTDGSSYSVHDISIADAEVARIKTENIEVVVNE